MNVPLQILSVFVFAVPIARVAWVITHQVFRKSPIQCAKRKVLNLFAGKGGVSLYLTTAFLVITRYRLLFPDWRGYAIAGFSVICVANIYLEVFGRTRLDTGKESGRVGKAERFARSR